MADSPGYRTWKAWRGSPEHVAQIARVSAAAVNAEGSGVRIAVEVPPYSETFTSVEAFKKNLSPEAVRDAKRIFIRAEGAVLRADIKFRMGARKQVALLIRSANGPGDPEIANVTRKIRPAIERGRVRRGDSTVVGVLVIFIQLAALGFAAWFLVLATKAVDLPDWAFIAVLIVWFIVGIAIIVGYAILADWVRPEVEVAELGQTRLWKFAKLAGPWLAGIIAAGVAKLVFG